MPTNKSASEHYILKILLLHRTPSSWISLLREHISGSQLWITIWGATAQEHQKVCTAMNITINLWSICWCQFASCLDLTVWSSETSTRCLSPYMKSHCQPIIMLFCYFPTLIYRKAASMIPEQWHILLDIVSVYSWFPQKNVIRGLDSVLTG